MQDRANSPVRSCVVTTSLLTAVFAFGLGGCANNNQSGVTARALPAGQSCRSIQRELRRMDARGVPAKVEAVNSGRKVSAQARAEANRYNDLLNRYLGARCHT